MPAPDSKSPFGRMLRGAFLLLAAAVAVHVAVKLIQDVWVWLLVIVSIIAAASLLAAWWRSRSRRW